MKLAIAQMVLDVVIISDFAFLLQLGRGAAFTTIVLGLLVLGCGVAQYLKARG